MDIVLLVGQSNMAGRGQAAASYAGAGEAAGVAMLSAKGEWVPAHDPVHFDKPERAGVGPGISFALAARGDGTLRQRVGLVPCAFGGTSLRRWCRGADLYDAAVQRARAALARAGPDDGGEGNGHAQGPNRLAAILWHQGESDCQDPAFAAGYEALLQKSLHNLRRDCVLPEEGGPGADGAGSLEVPVVLGELGRFLDTSDPTLRLADSINLAIHRVGRRLPRASVVLSDGLGDQGDGLHFSTEAAEALGRRYAAAFAKLLQQAPNMSRSTRS